MRKKECVLQHDESDCATAAIATILRHYGSEVPLIKLRELIGTDESGTTLKGMVSGLKSLKFNVKAIRVKIESLDREVTMPLIAQTLNERGNNHFVVVFKISKRGVYTLGDPETGIRKVSEKEFLKSFKGVLLIIIPKSDYEKHITEKEDVFSLFMRLILPQKQLFLTIILSSLLLSIIGIVLSTFSKVLMDEIIPYQLKNSLYIFLIAYGVIIFLQTILGTARQQAVLYLSRKVDIPVLMGYYDHIIHLPYNFFNMRKIGEITTRFQDAMTLKEVFTSLSLSLIMDIILAIGSSFILFHISPTMFLILVCMVLVDIVLVFFFKKPYKKFNYEQMEAGAILNSHLIESFQNIETVKSFNLENNAIEQLENNFVKALRIDYKVGTLSNIQGMVGGLFSTLGNLFFMAVGALFIIEGKMTIGDLLVFQTLSSYFTSPVSNLVSLQMTFQEVGIAIKRLREIMDLEREDLLTKDKIKNISLNESIVMNNINFSYSSRGIILRNISLEIPKGIKMALVGESGSGKTTIAKLLVHFMKPDSGQITVGNYYLEDIDYQYLRKKIIYLPQKAQLFSGTILENIKLGNDTKSYEEVLSAASKSGTNEFINNLPERFNTHVSEGGSNFSDGEKQRIVLARAILSDADVYIFDEITSNLDAINEQKVKRLIFDYLKEKTVILIAHRLSIAKDCDRIITLKKGCILENGTYEELMSKKSEFYNLYTYQNEDTVKECNKNETNILDYTISEEEMTYE